MIICVFPLVMHLLVFSSGGICCDTWGLECNMLINVGFGGGCFSWKYWEGYLGCSNIGSIGVFPDHFGCNSMRFHTWRVHNECSQYFGVNKQWRYGTWWLLRGFFKSIVDFCGENYFTTKCGNIKRLVFLLCWLSRSSFHSVVQKTSSV